jgi:hypothetical protein
MASINENDDLYILFITTHGVYPILYNNTPMNNNNINSNSNNNNFKFDIKTSPINFNHILAAPPGLCNLMYQENIDSIFYKDNSTITFIDSFLKYYVRDFDTMKLEKLSKLIKLHINTIQHTTLYNNDTRFHIFDDYGIIKRGNKFINKKFKFSNKNHFSSNINDFNIKLFKVTPNGLEEEKRIDMEFLTQTPLNYKNMNKENYFDLFKILKTLNANKIYNVTIVDYTCSNYSYPENKQHDLTSNNAMSYRFDTFYGMQPNIHKRNITNIENKNIKKIDNYIKKMVGRKRIITFPTKKKTRKTTKRQTKSKTKNKTKNKTKSKTIS